MMTAFARPPLQQMPPPVLGGAPDGLPPAYSPGAAGGPGGLSSPSVSYQAQIAPAAQPAPSRDALMALAGQLQRTFDLYQGDRRIVELRWLRNLRQYLGIYDPDIDTQLSRNRSRAYPRLTRVKCISTLSRIMNLMFPGDDRNWTLQASPSPDMDPADVMQALQQSLQTYAQGGMPPPRVDEAFVEQVVRDLAGKRAEALMGVIDDQLEEVGGDQSADYVHLNRKVLFSGIVYGLGVLTGPYAVARETTKWVIDPMSGQPVPQKTQTFKPRFEHLSVWDYYPDMAAKALDRGDGYFTRSTMSRSQVYELCDRSDFFQDEVRRYLKENRNGNYREKWYELELRTMGVKINVNMQKPESTKYEVLTWHGPISGHMLQQLGADVPEDKLADQVDAEVWMIGNTIIKAQTNPWLDLGETVKMVHTFVFDEDDTSPLGNGLPNVMRDSQMGLCAAIRMYMDNASVTCGPNLELNLSLLRRDQDLTGTEAYKIWYRDDDELGTTATAPAVRNVAIDGHLPELREMVELFLKLMDMETFVGPATGGDMEKAPSEPFRTAAGASMLRGDAALPFKDIIRQFDSFTQSVILSLVQFNKHLNSHVIKPCDYNVIARGATSLIAKEIRGMQVDQLATTLTPDEQLHVDSRKLVEERLKVRDLGDLLVSPEEAERRKQAQSQAAQAQQDLQEKQVEAMIRKTLADAYKSITQGAKNSAAADAASVNSALDVLNQGMGNGEGQGNAPAGPAKASSGGVQQPGSGGGGNAR